MSRFASQLASGRFAPATCALLVALAMVTVALVVRREMHARRTIKSTNELVAVAPPSVSSAAEATSPPAAESAATQGPTLPRLSRRPASAPVPTGPDPTAAPIAAPISTAPRVRTAVAGHGLSFPAADMSPTAAAHPPSDAPNDARPVAATADELLPNVVFESPSMDAAATYPWAQRAGPAAEPPPPQFRKSSAPATDPLGFGAAFNGEPPAKLAGPALTASTTKPAPGALRFPDSTPSSQAGLSPSLPSSPPPSSSPPAASPPVSRIVAADPRPSPGVLAFPQAATESRYDGRPTAANAVMPPYPSTDQPYADMPIAAVPVVRAPPPPTDAVYLAAEPTAAAPTVVPPPGVTPAFAPPPTPPPSMSGPPPAETLPRAESPGTVPFAAAPAAPREIPNPWSSFGASASLGRFAEHGTITLADVRMTALQNNKDVAVLGYVPRVAATAIDTEASVFDPTFNIAAAGGHYDRQTATQIQSLGSTIPVLKTSFAQPITAPNQIWLEKKFVTGGNVQVGVGQNYLNYNPAGSFVLINPSHQASANLSVEQPLFRGRGPNATLATTEIARANSAQSWHAFQASVNQVLRDAEIAYWETYAAYQEFEVRDLALAQARTTVERERERLRIGEGSVPDVAQAEERAEEYHIERTRAEIELIQAQRNLRRLMGLPPGDERPLIPATSPADEPPVVDWDTAAAEARNRPEFAAQAAAVEAAEIEVRRRRNGMLPDLSLRGIYAVSGLDSDFGNAWGSLGTFNFNDWTAGVVYKQPLGRRSDRALEQRAFEALSLESARLAQLEHEILHQLDAAYKNLQAAESLLDLHRKRREAAAVQLEARRDLYLENRAQLRDQLDAESRYASATLDEALAKVAYRRAVTDWNYARGAMTGDSVMVRQ